MNRQSLLAIIGGGCLGMLVGVALGAIAGHTLISVEAWEDQELYGFIGLVRRIRGIGIGSILGGLIGFTGGALFGALPPRHRGAPPSK